MLRPTRIALCATALVFLATGAAFALARHRVDQSGLRFSVASLQIQRGDMVVFSNNDRSSHNITVRGGAMAFNGGLQRPGQNIEVPFTAAGRYEVICGIHPRMRMEVEAR